jgi:carbon storage regulator CsrA
MLILSRKNQEAVVVGDTSGCEQLLKVTVLEVRGSCVKLGFEAGDEVPIHRAEVWDRILAESRAPDPGPIALRTKYRVPYID